MNGKRTDGPPERTALYRIRGEADVLLYIGITNSVAIRWNGHMRVQPWWDELRSLTVEWFWTRAEAEAAEDAAIKAERPKYNRTYLRPSGPKIARLPVPVAEYRTEVRRLDEPPDGAATAAEVAAYLRRLEKTLANWRSRKKGPSYIKAGGSIFYDWADVEEWFKSLPSGGAGVRRGAA